MQHHKMPCWMSTPRIRWNFRNFSHLFCSGLLLLDRCRTLSWEENVTAQLSEIKLKFHHLKRRMLSWAAPCLCHPCLWHFGCTMPGNWVWGPAVDPLSISCSQMAAAHSLCHVPRMHCKLKDNENSIYIITVRVKNGWSKLRVTGEWGGWREEMKYVSVLLWYQQLSTSGFVQKAELVSDNASCSASSLHCLTFFLLTTFPAIYALLGAWTAEIPGSCRAAKCLINTVEVIGHTTHTHREPAPLLPALLVNDTHLWEADVVGGILLFGLR